MTEYWWNVSCGWKTNIYSTSVDSIIMADDHCIKIKFWYFHRVCWWFVFPVLLLPMCSLWNPLKLSGCRWEKGLLSLLCVSSTIRNTFKMVLVCKCMDSADGVIFSYVIAISIHPFSMPLNPAQGPGGAGAYSGRVDAGQVASPPQGCHSNIKYKKVTGLLISNSLQLISQTKSCL